MLVVPTISPFLLILALLAPAAAGLEPYREVLPNGLTLIIRESHSNPVVSLNVFVQVGSVDETPETSGMAHFYEHMFFRGTPSHSGFEFKRAIESLGGTTNASTTRDFTHYYINLPSRYALEGLELLADALINAQCSPEAIDQERKAVREEFRLGQENPYRVIHNRIFALAYPDHPYGRPVIGTLENIDRFRRRDFLAFRDRYYTPQRVTVVIAGDVDRREILPAARRLFGGFSRSGPPPASFPVGEPPSGEQEVIEEAPLRASFVVLGFRGPSVKDRPDIYRMDVLSFLLGIGRGSKLSRRLVDRDLAYEARVDFLTQRYPGLVILVAVGEPGREQELKQALLECVRAVRNGDFTERELRRAKALLRSTYLFGKETAAGKADNLGFYETIDRVDFTSSYLQEVDRVDREAVVQAARQYLGGGYYSLIVRPRSPGRASR